MLELTPNFLENPFADVYVYFSSRRFDSDPASSNPLIPGYHGESLCHWLRQQLAAQGYTVLDARPNRASWTFMYVNCHYRWDVYCENIIRHNTTEWKITINSNEKAADGAGRVPPDQCLAFLTAIKKALDDNPDIYAIEWNRALLNKQENETERSRTSPDVEGVN